MTTSIQHLLPPTSPDGGASVLREGRVIPLAPQTRLHEGAYTSHASLDDDPELELLGERPGDDGIDAGAAAHTLRTAPVLTGDAINNLDMAVIPQRAVYGLIVSQHVPGFATIPVSPKLYVNSNTPFSALICGVQGSGKSHTTSVLLESCLIRDKRLGTLPSPLSGLVFHFDTAAGGGHTQPCEAAYLASLDPSRAGAAQPPEVVVLVLPGDLKKMKKVYGSLPGVRVEPLHFASDDISGERLLAMMKVDESAQMPLYMESIMSMLRSMDEFNYDEFRKRLGEQKFNPSQKAMLNLRLSLLDSCLKGGTKENRVANYLKAGTLTIVDLSSQFMDSSSACGFFDIILGLFVEVDISAGKLVVLDEAHKYLTSDGSSSRLTDSLLTVIRQQRHLNTRIVVSTQEPTVVPSSFLDLCSFIIAHRFSSPKWLHHLADHVSSADTSAEQLFSKIVSLQTGQAVMFAPSGLGARENAQGGVTTIGQGYLLVRSRQRITRDGGHSLLAVQDPEYTTSLGGGVVVPSVTSPNRIGTPAQSNNGSASDGYLSSSESTLFSSPAQSIPNLCMETARRAVNEQALPVVRRTPAVSTSTAPIPASVITPSAISSNRHIPQNISSLSDVAQTLIKILKERHSSGTIQSVHSDIGAALRSRHPNYAGKLSRYVKEAQDAGFITSSSPPGPEAWIRLTSAAVPNINVQRNLNFRPLAHYLSQKGGKADMSEIASLRVSSPGTIGQGKGQVAVYLEAAKAAGVINMKGSKVTLK